MALNFPSNPTSGDQYTSSNTTWEFDGTAWNVVASQQANAFGIVSVDGTSITADSAVDTLNIIGGTDISLNTDLGTNTFTINSTAAGGGGGGGGSDYSDADVDLHLNTSTATSGQILSWTGSDYDWVADQTGSGGSTTFSGTTDATQASLTIDKIYEPAIAMYRVDNIGTSSYTFASHYPGANPTIYVIAGTTIAFDLDAVPGHPFEIQDPLGDPYNTGLIHVTADGTITTGSAAQGKDNGTLYWRISESISGGYRYQCQNHAGMVGAITVKRLSLL